MSKINQIEDALKQIDQATFQKLMDSYLIKIGYRQLPFPSITPKNRI